MEVKGFLGDDLVFFSTVVTHLSLNDLASMPPMGVHLWNSSFPCLHYLTDVIFILTWDNLFCRGWGFLLCRGWIQPLPAGSRSSRTWDSLHASTCPRLSAGNGPGSSYHTQRTPWAGHWPNPCHRSHQNHLPINQVRLFSIRFREISREIAGGEQGSLICPPAKSIIFTYLACLLFDCLYILPLDWGFDGGRRGARALFFSL